MRKERKQRDRKTEWNGKNYYCIRERCCQVEREKEDCLSAAKGERNRKKRKGSTQKKRKVMVGVKQKKIDMLRDREINRQ